MHGTARAGVENSIRAVERTTACIVPFISPVVLPISSVFAIFSAAFVNSRYRIADGINGTNMIKNITFKGDVTARLNPPLFPLFGLHWHFQTL
jgi:hypothetical protein